MSVILTESLVQAAIAFHGHWCPGLAWGLRVSEAALAELGPRDVDEELVAVVETDNCAVDAIQFLTGCSFGKGNLRYLDHGQNVFTFTRRRDKRSLRISRNPAWEMPASANDQHSRAEALMSAPIAELLIIEELNDYSPPEKAQILPSRPCAACNQPTMATRLFTLTGRELCFRCLQRELDGAVLLRPIGVVHSGLIAGAAPPRARCERAVIELDEQFEPALLRIEEHSQLQVLFVFDRAPADAPLQQHRMGDASTPLRGVFGLRSPHRPNPLGLTMVRLLAVEGKRLFVSGLDAWDGTPVLDIKPWSAENDTAAAPGAP